MVPVPGFHIVGAGKVAQTLATLWQHSGRYCLHGVWSRNPASAQQLLERLNVSLNQLSLRQQQIFILSRLHGHSYQQIAEHLGVSLSTVQKELKLIMAICVGVADRLNH